MVALDRKLRPALAGVLYHHERWDGDGYPTGRAGASIPIEARVLAVADSFDAMTSDRPTGSRCRARRRSPSSTAAAAPSSTRPSPSRSSEWAAGGFGVTVALGPRPAERGV